MIQEGEAEFMALHEAKRFVYDLQMPTGSMARMELILECAFMLNSVNLKFWYQVHPSSGQTVYMMTFEFFSVL